MSEAFVYCWTDKKTNMLYIGSHKGSVNDGYVCSSKYMLEEYNKRPEDFSRQIIAEGTIEDIRKLESKILQACNVSKNEMFYNKHQNDGFFFAGWRKGEMTDEHRKNLSIAAKKRKRTEEHINSLIESRRGKKNSPEHNLALLLSRLGSTHTEETKQLMSEAKKNNPKTKENASLAGKKSQQARKQSGYYDSEEWKLVHKKATETRKANKLKKQKEAESDDN